MLSIFGNNVFYIIIFLPNYVKIFFPKTIISFYIFINMDTWVVHMHFQNTQMYMYIDPC